MTLSEVLKVENRGKKFRCKDNHYTVRNDNCRLIYLEKTFMDDGAEYWRDCIISIVWVNAEYELIDIS